MATRKGTKFTKAHRAKLAAAATKRWAKKQQNPYSEMFKEANAKIGTTLRVRLPNDYQVEERTILKTNGLISRMTQAIDKIETQIKRLESL